MFFIRAIHTLCRFGPCSLPSAPSSYGCFGACPSHKKIWFVQSLTRNESLEGFKGCPAGAPLHSQSWVETHTAKRHPVVDRVSAMSLPSAMKRLRSQMMFSLSCCPRDQTFEGAAEKFGWQNFRQARSRSSGMKEWLEAGSAQGARVGPLQGAEASG